MKIAICVLLLVSLAVSVPCNKGGLLCGEGQCHYPAYIEGCLTYGTDDACAQCEYNYLLKNGGCLYAPNNNAQDCCLRFDNSSRCVECSKGLILSQTSGLCEDFKIVGCLQKDQNGCAICASNYDLVGKICVKSVSGCTAYDQKFNCVACINTTTLYQGACVTLTSQITPPNCKTVNEYGCAECLPGFRLDANNNCQATTVVGCIKFNTDGDCLLCLSPNFQLTSGKCSIVGCLQTEQGICKSCDTSLGFQLNNGRCEIANCIYFSEKGCQLCRNGLAAGSWGCKPAIEKVCQICKVDEFLGNDGKCSKKDVHCVQYKGGYCQKCCETYFLDSSAACKPKLPGCVYQNSTCASCVAPFRYDSANSVCLIIGCLDYDYQGCVKCDSRLILNNRECGLPNCEEVKDFTCTKCISGYNLDSTGQCVPADPNCALKNPLNQCLKCKEGYKLGKDGKCTIVKFGCNYVDGRCTSCRAPFLYNPEKECCEIDGCESYFIGGCAICANGYSLLYNTCKLPNCLISKKGKCLQCDPDFVFRSDGTCVSKDEFCDKMDQSGTCIKCMESYFYSQKEKKCVHKSPGCRYDDKDNCVACDAPFTAQPGRCVIPGCLIMKQSGCAECQYPYQLSKDKTCEIAHCTKYQNGRCAGCLEGYALSDNKLCLVADEFCIEYNSDRTTCTKCRKGYRFDNNGKCQYADAHCWDFDNSGVCTNCDRLYFLNSLGKCQLRDPVCITYVNGFCTTCRPYYFVKEGVCMANILGCKVQKSYNNCVACDRKYYLQEGICKSIMTPMEYNLVKMDFFEGKDEKQQEDSKNTFTSGINTKVNLIQAITSGASVFYSSSTINNAAYQVDSAGNVGWSPKITSQSCKGQFIGVKLKTLQTFYAVDIKYFAGNSLKRFSIQYSMDGINYISIEKFSLEGMQLGITKTFYFIAVQALSIRIVVEQGIPHIKFDFYYSDTTALARVDSKIKSTFISKTISESIEGVMGGVSQCGDNALCWAGVEACEPRKIKGFRLEYTCDPKNDFVSEVKIDYSMDGKTFTCWNSCQSIALVNGGYVFQEPVLAEKMHIHFSKYSGKPKFGIHFDWA